MNCFQRQNPFRQEGELSHACSSSDSRSLVQLLGQAGLFPIGGILMNNALGNSLIDHGGSRGQLLFGIARISGNCSIELADSSTHSALDNAVMQILLFADLHTFLGGLNIRQPGSPPLRMLKKPSLSIITCLLSKCKPFCCFFHPVIRIFFFDISMFSSIMNSASQTGGIKEYWPGCVRGFWEEHLIRFIRAICMSQSACWIQGLWISF